MNTFVINRSMSSIELKTFLTVKFKILLFLCWAGIRYIPNTTRNASTLVSSFESSIAKIPIREAVRYTKKNMKWSAEEFRVRNLSFVLFNITEATV